MARKVPVGAANISSANDARAKTFGGRRGQQVHDTATERVGGTVQTLTTHGLVVKCEATREYGGAFPRRDCSQA